MAQEDKIKWNKKYEETPSLLKSREVSKKLVETIEKVKGKKVLEIACGAGRNSIFLANRGFSVEAFDISDFAIESIKNQNIKNITAKVMDLEGYIPSKESYDLIVMTNYLDRELIPNLAKALKKEGILFIETYMNHKDNEKAPSNPDYLLKKNELKSFFNEEYEILDYDEFLNESYELFRMQKQFICVKKL